MKWTKEQERELNRLCFEEKSNVEIANHFDRALKDIYAARSRLGLTIDKVKAAKAALAKDRQAAQEETRSRREERGKNNMKSTGLVRRMDDLGRVVIPKEVRRTLDLHEGDPLEIFVAAGDVIFRKYNGEE